MIETDWTMLSRIPVVDQRIAWRTVAGEARIVSVDDSRLHHLDPIGTFIWEQIEGGGVSVAELVDAVVSRYRVTPEEASADTVEFLRELEHLGLVHLQDAPADRSGG